MAKERPLNETESRAIELYCDEEGKFFLRKHESYKAAYFTEKVYNYRKMSFGS